MNLDPEPALQKNSKYLKFASEIRDKLADIDKSLTQTRSDSNAQLVSSRLRSLQGCLEDHREHLDVPEKAAVLRSLQACLVDCQSAGVHKQVTQTLEYMIKLMGPNLPKSLPVFLVSLLCRLPQAASETVTQMRDLLKGIIQKTNGNLLKPCTEGIIAGLLPALEQTATGDDKESMKILDAMLLKLSVDCQFNVSGTKAHSSNFTAPAPTEGVRVFFHTLWYFVAFDPTLRPNALTLLSNRLFRADIPPLVNLQELQGIPPALQDHAPPSFSSSTPDDSENSGLSAEAIQLAYLGGDVNLAVRAICIAALDSQEQTQSRLLELLLRHLPLDSEVLSRDHKVEILSRVLFIATTNRNALLMRLIRWVYGGNMELEEAVVFWKETSQSLVSEALQTMVRRCVSHRESDVSKAAGKDRAHSTTLPSTTLLQTLQLKEQQQNLGSSSSTSHRHGHHHGRGAHHNHSSNTGGQAATGGDKSAIATNSSRTSSGPHVFQVIIALLQREESSHTFQTLLPVLGPMISDWVTSSIIDQENAAMYLLKNQSSSSAQHRSGGGQQQQRNNNTRFSIYNAIKNQHHQGDNNGNNNSDDTNNNQRSLLDSNRPSLLPLAVSSHIINAASQVLDVVPIELFLDGLVGDVRRITLTTLQGKENLDLFPMAETCIRKMVLGVEIACNFFETTSNTASNSATSSSATLNRVSIKAIVNCARQLCHAAGALFAYFDIQGRGFSALPLVENIFQLCETICFRIAPTVPKAHYRRAIVYGVLEEVSQLFQVFNLMIDQKIKNVATSLLSSPKSPQFQNQTFESKTNITDAPVLDEEMQKILSFGQQQQQSSTSIELESPLTNLSEAHHATNDLISSQNAIVALATRILPALRILVNSSSSSSAGLEHSASAGSFQTVDSMNNMVEMKTSESAAAFGPDEPVQQQQQHHHTDPQKTLSSPDNINNNNGSPPSSGTTTTVISDDGAVEAGKIISRLIFVVNTCFNSLQIQSEETAKKNREQQQAGQQDGQLGADDLSAPASPLSASGNYFLREDTLASNMMNVNEGAEIDHRAEQNDDTSPQQQSSQTPSSVNDSLLPLANRAVINKTLKRHFGANRAAISNNNTNATQIAFASQQHRTEFEAHCLECVVSFSRFWLTAIDSVSRHDASTTTTSTSAAASPSSAGWGIPPQNIQDVNETSDIVLESLWRVFHPRSQSLHCDATDVFLPLAQMRNETALRLVSRPLDADHARRCTMVLGEVSKQRAFAFHQHSQPSSDSFKFPTWILEALFIVSSVTESPMEACSIDERAARSVCESWIKTQVIRSPLFVIRPLLIGCLSSVEKEEEVVIAVAQSRHSSPVQQHQQQASDGNTGEVVAITTNHELENMARKSRFPSFIRQLRGLTLASQNELIRNALSNELPLTKADKVIVSNPLVKALLGDFLQSHVASSTQPALAAIVKVVGVALAHACDPLFASMTSSASNTTKQEQQQQFANATSLSDFKNLTTSLKSALSTAVQTGNAPLPISKMNPVIVDTIRLIIDLVKGVVRWSPPSQALSSIPIVATLVHMLLWTLRQALERSWVDVIPSIVATASIGLDYLHRNSHVTLPSISGNNQNANNFDVVTAPDLNRGGGTNTSSETTKQQSSGILWKLCAVCIESASALFYGAVLYEMIGTFSGLGVVQTAGEFVLNTLRWSGPLLSAATDSFAEVNEMILCLSMNAALNATTAYSMRAASENLQGVISATLKLQEIFLKKSNELNDKERQERTMSVFASGFGAIVPSFGAVNSGNNNNTSSSTKEDAQLNQVIALVPRQALGDAISKLKSKVSSTIDIAVTVENFLSISSRHPSRARHTGAVHESVVSLTELCLQLNEGSVVERISHNLLPSHDPKPIDVFHLAMNPSSAPRELFNPLRLLFGSGVLLPGGFVRIVTDHVLKRKTRLLNPNGNNNQSFGQPGGGDINASFGDDRTSAAVHSDADADLFAAYTVSMYLHELFFNIIDNQKPADTHHNHKKNHQTNNSNKSPKQLISPVFNSSAALMELRASILTFINTLVSNTGMQQQSGPTATTGNPNSSLQQSNNNNNNNTGGNTNINNNNNATNLESLGSGPAGDASNGKISNSNNAGFSPYLLPILIKLLDLTLTRCQAANTSVEQKDTNIVQDAFAVFTFSKEGIRLPDLYCKMVTLCVGNVPTPYLNTTPHILKQDAIALSECCTQAALRIFANKDNLERLGKFSIALIKDSICTSVDAAQTADLRVTMWWSLTMAKSLLIACGILKLNESQTTALRSSVTDLLYKDHIFHIGRDAIQVLQDLVGEVSTCTATFNNFVIRCGERPRFRLTSAQHAQECEARARGLKRLGFFLFSSRLGTRELYTRLPQVRELVADTIRIAIKREDDCPAQTNEALRHCFFVFRVLLFKVPSEHSKLLSGLWTLLFPEALRALHSFVMKYSPTVSTGSGKTNSAGGASSTVKGGSGDHAERMLITEVMKFLDFAHLLSPSDISPIRWMFCDSAGARTPTSFTPVCNVAMRYRPSVTLSGRTDGKAPLVRPRNYVRLSNNYNNIGSTSVLLSSAGSSRISNDFDSYNFSSNSYSRNSNNNNNKTASTNNNNNIHSVPSSAPSITEFDGTDFTPLRPLFALPPHQTPTNNEGLLNMIGAFSLYVEQSSAESSKASDFVASPEGFTAQQNSLFSETSEDEIKKLFEAGFLKREDGADLSYIDWLLETDFLDAHYYEVPTNNNLLLLNGSSMQSVIPQTPTLMSSTAAAPIAGRSFSSTSTSQNINNTNPPVETIEKKLQMDEGSDATKQQQQEPTTPRQNNNENSYDDSRNASSLLPPSAAADTNNYDNNNNQTTLEKQIAEKKSDDVEEKQNQPEKEKEDEVQDKKDAEETSKTIAVEDSDNFDLPPAKKNTEKEQESSSSQQQNGNNNKVSQEDI